MLNLFHADLSGSDQDSTSAAVKLLDFSAKEGKKKGEQINAANAPMTRFDAPNVHRDAIKSATIPSKNNNLFNCRAPVIHNSPGT
ncbi:Hypothetical protein PP7435_CHR1-0427 [Komagataella phaffii CBS 7435]|uniref:Uncharacterized protein n=1 Tax=Komagataella phaffii (strain ATCC 76273 / CBS 7435 / CECT 11047 / NRRL Y-11430 / Wegner 21-1) TaxID=981350 RepID=F2QMD3_KOMPC|nr:Hypothetical protein PP7435_CHR1-0427 [Komagataella phaffii CBS 7435]